MSKMKETGTFLWNSLSVRYFSTGVCAVIGKRSVQMGLFDVGNVYAVKLRAGSFEAQLASVSERLFQDEDFRGLYDAQIGRPSVPPSQLALLMLLQTEAGVSDQEAVDRTGCDLRWAAVLRKPAGDPLCAKSTLQLFRAHLVLHEAAQLIFQRSIDEAVRSGLLRRGSPVRVAIDTKPMIGRGAVADTYNLLATGIVNLARAMALGAGSELGAWLAANDLSRYEGTSFKGSAEIDWSDKEARRSILNEVVTDARRILRLASGGSASVRNAASLLSQLLLQDVEDGEDGRPQVRTGTAADRIPSATDPDQRHGHKSKRGQFIGHKTEIVIEPESQIIAAAGVLAGNAPDATGALDMVRQAGENTGCPVDQAVGDCAYGNPETRQEFTDANIDLVAKVPVSTNSTGLLPKSAFTIDLETNTVTCPEGHSTNRFGSERSGGRVFKFGPMCRDCPSRALCTKSAEGRVIHVHPKERMLQEARARQRSVDGRAVLRTRIGVEHRLARLGQLGIGRARYVGHAKTRVQIHMACAVANLRRTWNWLAGKGLAPDGLVFLLVCLSLALRSPLGAIRARGSVVRLYAPPNLRRGAHRLARPLTVATETPQRGFRPCF